MTTWRAGNYGRIIRFIRKSIAICVELYSYPKTVIEDLGKISEKYPFNRFSLFKWQKLLDHISGISCGYGVKVERIILWILGSIIIFALIYSQLRVIVKTEVTNTNPIGNTITNSTSFIDCLYFSTMVFTAQIPANMHAIGPWMYIVAIEKLLVYLFLALFVVVLAKKLIR